jgi:hypothetical protein
MGLYSTYFDSTKTNSNDFIGALGLGSKSPFSYTKAFEVVSRFDGTRRIYSVFINEEGVPTIARLGEFPTTDPNGLEVKITIQKSDFQLFASKVATTLRWFPTKPRLVGYPRFEYAATPKENLAGDGWMMFDSDFAGDYSKMTAVQGNVAYKVDISKLDLDEVDQRLLQNCHVVGFFNIGDLEVAASREEIRYDARSVKNLIDRVRKVRDGIRHVVEKQVNELADKTFWQQTIALNNLATNMFSNIGLFLSFINESHHPIINRYRRNHGMLSVGHFRGWDVTSYSPTRGYDVDKAIMRRNQVTGSIQPETNIVVFINDLKIGGVSKVQHYLREQARVGKHLTAYLVRKIDDVQDVEFDPKDSTKIVVRTPWTEEQYEDEFETLHEGLGEVDLISTTTLEAAPRKKADAKGLAVFKFNGVRSRSSSQRVQWTRVTDLDVNKGGLYFFIQHGAHITLITKDGVEKKVSWYPSDVEANLKEAVRLINASLGTNYNMANLYGIGAQVAKKIKKLHNWFNIFDILKTEITKYEDAVKYFRSVRDTSDIMHLRPILRLDMRGSRYRQQYIDRINKLQNDSQFKQTCMPLIQDAQKFEKFGTMVEMLQKLDVDIGLNLLENIKGKAYYGASDFSKYSMLTFINSLEYLTPTQINTMFDYIETIDRS